MLCELQKNFHFLLEQSAFFFHDVQQSGRRFLKFASETVSRTIFILRERFGRVLTSLADGIKVIRAAHGPEGSL